MGNSAQGKPSAQNKTGAITRSPLSLALVFTAPYYSGDDRRLKNQYMMGSAGVSVGTSPLPSSMTIGSGIASPSSGGGVVSSPHQGVSLRLPSSSVHQMVRA